MMGEIRAVIVDDEPFARERVRRLLEREAGIVVVGEAGNGFDAVTLINKQSPDLLFLDVQMPGKDGFSVLEELPAAQTPLVIFLTAYDTYAVRAFEAAALDYLLKPFDPERFARAVARARARLAQPDGDDGPGPDRADTPAAVAAGAAGVAEVTANGSFGQETEYLERIIIRTGGRVIFRRTDEIDWIEAYGNYVRLHIAAAAYLLRETISNLEAQLDPAKFVRIHRSTLVQISRVREIQPLLSGQSRIILRDGTQLTLSRRYRRRLPKSLAGE